ERLDKPVRTGTVECDSPISCSRHERRRHPRGRGIVDPRALEYFERLAQVSEAGTVNGADLALRIRVAAALCALHDTLDVLFDGIGRDESKVGEKASPPRHCGLTDCGVRPQGRFNREALAAGDVLQHETLTLGSHGPANVTRNCAVA